MLAGIHAFEERVSNGTCHGREECRTQTDAESNFNTVLLAPMEKTGTSIDQTSRYEDHHRADAEMNQTQTGVVKSLRH